ncbi:predicted protein, partial [Nematostella vectensis]
PPLIRRPIFYQSPPNIRAHILSEPPLIKGPIFYPRPPLNKRAHILSESPPPPAHQ